MALIDKSFTFSNGAVISAAEHNTNFNTIYNDYNGNITDANIAAGALIGLTKLDLSDDATFTGTLTFTGSNSTRKVTRQANYGTHYTQGTAPSTGADEIAVYSKDSGTQPEMFVREESDGDEVQITKDGAINNQFPFIVKAWVTFDGSAAHPITKDGGYNIDGTITKNGNGDYTINWDTDFADTNYAVVVTSGTVDILAHIVSKAAGSVRIETTDTNGTATNGSVVDVIAIGNQ